MIGIFLMKPLLLHADLWDDYALIDSGNGEKLERFGRYFFSRPEPQAFWGKKLSPKVWNNVSGKFLTSSTADNDNVK